MPDYEFNQDKILEGIEIIEVLDELDTAYDSFLQLSYHGSKDEIEEHKDYIEDLVGHLEEGPEESSYDNLLENLDTAFESAIRFNRASGEDRLKIKEEDEEAYHLLVQSRPSKVSVDEPRLLERFKPNAGGHYDLTRRVIHDGADSLDAWPEKIEEQEEKQEPATTPEDREDTANDMFH